MSYKDWPKHALKLIVLLACSTAVIFQLAECIMKLSYPPVSTHTELDVNASMEYPALTVCRNPPYKPDVLKKHGLGSEIRYTSEWTNFPFNTTTLTNFWHEATYSRAETISQFGLDKLADNINVSTAFHFLSGRCHTLRPQVSTHEAGLDAGYSLTLRHSSNPTLHKAWTIYVHQPSDVWTENNVQTTGVQEAVMLPVGEETHVKLAVQQLRRVNHPRSPCRPEYNYSATKCVEQCRWQEMAQAVGCSVPWMPGTGLPECNNYHAITYIIKEYLRFEASPTCNRRCERACSASHFSAFFVSRGSVEGYLPGSFSQIYVFHSSKLVTSVREKWDYDISRFVADAGGSLGFLLGVSVLSLVGLLGKAFRTLTTCGSSQHEDTSSDVTSLNSSSIHSKVTIPVTPTPPKY